MKYRARSGEKRFSTASKINCPECGFDLPVYANYSPWCHECHWNLSPSYSFAPSSIGGKVIALICQNLDKFMFKQIKAYQSNRFSFSSRYVAVSIATLFYLINIALFLVGLKALSGFAEGNLVAATIGLFISAAIFWTLFPKFEESPPDEVLTQADEFPMLNEIVSQVAAELGVAKPDIMLTESFTATFGRIGPRQKPVLMLGHPFLSILDRQEIIALVAHELTHSRDGAWSRHFYVRMCRTALQKWLQLFNYRQLQTDSDLINVAFLPAMLLFWLLSRPFEWLARAFTICSLRDAQRAEYVADHASTMLAGVNSCSSLLKKSVYCYSDALRYAYTHASDEDKTEAIAWMLGQIPERELDRLVRITCAKQRTMRDSHPPHQLRMEYIEGLPAHTPMMEMSQADYSTLRYELGRWPIIIRARELALLSELDREEAMSKRKLATAQI